MKNEMALTKTQTKTLVTELVREAEKDGLKDAVKKLMTVRREKVKEITRLQAQVKEAEKDLSAIDERVQGLASGDLTVLDDDTITCGNCRTCYNGMFYAACPSCGRFR